MLARRPRWPVPVEIIRAGKNPASPGNNLIAASAPSGCITKS
jgi:hypothetical protein